MNFLLALTKSLTKTKGSDFCSLSGMTVHHGGEGVVTDSSSWWKRRGNRRCHSKQQKCEVAGSHPGGSGSRRGESCLKFIWFSSFSLFTHFEIPSLGMVPSTLGVGLSFLEMPSHIYPKMGLVNPHLRFLAPIKLTL